MTLSVIIGRYFIFMEVSTLNIAIIDDMQQDLDALAAVVREYYTSRQLSIQLHTFSSPVLFYTPLPFSSYPPPFPPIVA